MNFIINFIKSFFHWEKVYRKYQEYIRTNETTDPLQYLIIINKAFRHVETLYQTYGKQTLLLVNKR